MTHFHPLESAHARRRKAERALDDMPMAEATMGMRGIINGSLITILIVAMIYGALVVL